MWITSIIQYSFHDYFWIWSELISLNNNLSYSYIVFRWLKLLNISTDKKDIMTKWTMTDRQCGHDYQDNNSWCHEIIMNTMFTSASKTSLLSLGWNIFERINANMKCYEWSFFLCSMIWGNRLLFLLFILMDMLTITA